MLPLLQWSKCAMISQRAFCLPAGSPSHLTVLHVASGRLQCSSNSTTVASVPLTTGHQTDRGYCGREHKNERTVSPSLPKAQRVCWYGTLQHWGGGGGADCNLFEISCRESLPPSRSREEPALQHRVSEALQTADGGSRTLGVPSHCPAQRTTLCAPTARLGNPLFVIFYWLILRNMVTLKHLCCFEICIKI